MYLLQHKITIVDDGAFEKLYSVLFTYRRMSDFTCFIYTCMSRAPSSAALYFCVIRLVCLCFYVYLIDLCILYCLLYFVSGLVENKYKNIR